MRPQSLQQLWVEGIIVPFVQNEDPAESQKRIFGPVFPYHAVSLYSQTDGPARSAQRDLWEP